MIYEIMIVLPSRIADSEVETAIDGVGKIILGVGGTIEKTTNLGKIKLAYPIAGQNHGTYVLFYAEVPAKSMKKMEQNFRLADDVLRHMVIARPKGIPTAPFKMVSYTAPLTPEGRRAYSDRDDRPRVAAKTDASAVSAAEMESKLDAILESDIVKNA